MKLAVLMNVKSMFMINVEMRSTLNTIVTLNSATNSMAALTNAKFRMALSAKYKIQQPPAPISSPLQWNSSAWKRKCSKIKCISNSDYRLSSMFSKT